MLYSYLHQSTSPPFSLFAWQRDHGCYLTAPASSLFSSPELQVVAAAKILVVAAELLVVAAKFLVVAAELLVVVAAAFS